MDRLKAAGVPVPLSGLPFSSARDNWKIRAGLFRTWQEAEAAADLWHKLSQAPK